MYCMSDAFLLDFIDPVIFAEASVRDICNQLKHLVTEASDVDDVCRFLCLGCPIRLQVDTDHLRLWISLLERIPLSHRLGGSTGRQTIRVNPRFVVGNVDDQITRGLEPVQMTQRQAAVRSARGRFISF